MLLQVKFLEWTLIRLDVPKEFKLLKTVFYFLMALWNLVLHQLHHFCHTTYFVVDALAAISTRWFHDFVKVSVFPIPLYLPMHSQ